MWLYPYLTLLTIAAMTGILAAMALQPETRSQLLLSLLSAGIVLAAFGLRRRFGSRSAAAA